MLSDAVMSMPVGSTLYTWSGKLQDCTHSSVLSHFVRLRLFHRLADGVLFKEIPPYRPASVHKGVTQNEDLHRLLFGSEPLFLIKAGPRKGRHARDYDLYRNEDAVRIDLETYLDFEDDLDGQEPAVAHSLDICSAMFTSFQAAGGSVTNLSATYVPAFMLSTKKGGKVYVRTGQSEGGTRPLEENGHIRRDANIYYGQGVWCVDPSDLGYWYRCDGDLVSDQPGYGVDVRFGDGK